MTRPQFGPHGPFDVEERRIIEDVLEAADRADRPGAQEMIRFVCDHVGRLERLGELAAAFPSLHDEQSLGQRKRDLSTFIAQLSRTNLSNFDIHLPTKALLGRDLVLAEVNFYRFLRLFCDETLDGATRDAAKREVERLLVSCLYARLAEEVLKSIVSDEAVRLEVREKAIRALTQIWEEPTYRMQDSFPALQATWEARRRISPSLGTLLGTTEIFNLLREGCDPEFVDHLVRPDHTEDEADAFREFLFGTTTEKIRRIEREMRAWGLPAIRVSDLRPEDAPIDPQSAEDPATAMFEFFLTRHLEAAARRLATLPGPKRTAEEYVMLHHLEKSTPGGPPGAAV